ncbi:MAG: NADH-quinone oxidoreductase subunit J family protein [Candidatus Binatia bacterium]
MTAEFLLFLIVASIALGSAIVVILHPNPVYCALALVIALFQVAALFVLLGAQMIAFLQIIVYAGAIMVLFLFVIMLLNLRQETEPASGEWRVAAGVAGSVLAAELAWFFLSRPMPEAQAPVDGFGSVTSLARSLFTDHVLSFELTSILLLVAVVGAVVIARKG